MVSVLTEPLREELEQAEAQFRADIAEAQAAKGRATELIRSQKMDPPFEVLEHELEIEHEKLVAYHPGKLVKKIRWVLEAWADSQEE
jgi:hypothetical protein